jgi:hypothetical protein
MVPVGSTAARRRRAPLPRPSYEPEEVARHDQGLSLRWQPEEPHLGQLDAGMKPGAVGPEQDLGRTGPVNGVEKHVETPHPCRVGVDIGMVDEMTHEGDLGAPVVGKAAQVRDDEVDVRLSSANSWATETSPVTS